MERKVAIIGGGVADIAMEVAKATAKEVNDLVVITTNDPDNQYAIPITKIPEVKLFEEKLKPTCKRHHEYVKTEMKNGNIIHGVWTCRFCGRIL